MRVYDGMPSFLNPLETIVGGFMYIEVGSKWVRHSLYVLRSDADIDYFVGQQVAVNEICRGGVCFTLYSERGVPSGKAWIEYHKFINHFSPLNFSLENK